MGKGFVNSIYTLLLFAFIIQLTCIDVMYSLVDFYYNRSAQKKISKNTTFIEKLLFRGWKERIPKFFYISYYSITAINALIIISYALVKYAFRLSDLTDIIFDISAIFNGIILLSVLVAFWQPNWRVNGYKFERWLKK